MTAVTIDLVEETERRPLPATLVLAWHEGRRMALHPISLLGLVVMLGYAAGVADNGPRDAFEVTSSGVTYGLGVPVYFAANLVASRDRRARSRELLAAVPVSPQARVRALCLGALVPAAAALAVVAVLHAVLLERGDYLVAPSAWHLVTGPVTVLGAALLGVMVSRWAPVPGAAALGMVAMVAWNVVWVNRPDHWAPLGTYVGWTRWDVAPDWIGFIPGSPSWHVAYLLGLCAMAATGALLPGAARRWPVLLVGATLTGLTAVLGAVQLT